MQSVLFFFIKKSMSRPSILKYPTIANTLGASPISPWVPPTLIPIPTWFSFPLHQAILPHQPDDLQFNSILMISTWR